MKEETFLKKRFKSRFVGYNDAVVKFKPTENLPNYKIKGEIYLKVASYGGRRWTPYRKVGDFEISFIEFKYMWNTDKYF